MLELGPLAVTPPALFTLFGAGALCPAGHVAALSVLWSSSETSTAAFLDLLCSFFAAPKSMDWGAC